MYKFLLNQVPGLRSQRGPFYALIGDKGTTKGGGRSILVRLKNAYAIRSDQSRARKEAVGV